ncbi:MAG: hypothetical protein U0667_14925 [Chloroflexota bacterium]
MTRPVDDNSASSGAPSEDAAGSGAASNDAAGPGTQAAGPDAHAAGADAEARTAAVAARLGMLIRTERRAHDLSLARLADAAGVSTTRAQSIEAGSPATLGTYVRLVLALDRRLVVDITDLASADAMAPADGRPVSDGQRAVSMDRDIVHAAMGEFEASKLMAFGLRLGIDVPWQHYRFGGRADVIAWDVRRRAMLLIENKGQLPDVQDALGRFNERQAYLGAALWQRLGLAGPPLVETHVLVGLWSAEVIDVVRRHPATFRATFPSPAQPFLAWWSADIPEPGITSTFLLLDPFAGGRAARFVDLREVLGGARPRLPGYAAAADLVRRGRSGTP